MEEFVNVELAIKLKELGYNISFFFFYRTDDKKLYHARVSNPLVYGKEIDDEVIIAPTISQVLKWLRDEKNLFVYPFTVQLPEDERLGERSGKRMWDFSVDDLNIDDCIFESQLKYHSYEEAAMAGIEWVLNNLI